MSSLLGQSNVLRGRWLALALSGGWHWLGTVATLTLAVAFVGVAWGDWAEAPTLLRYPFTLDYGEGVVVSQAARLRTELPLYPASDRAGPGFVGANYPPLYYLIVAVAPGSPATPYLSARLVSFAGYLLCALLAGLLVGRLARDLPAGVLTGAVVLALPPAQEWGLFAKPDLLALALSTAGLTVACLAPKRVLWAAPCFALALLTKQSLIAAPLAVGLALLLTPGRRRAALALAGLTAALVAAPLLLFMLDARNDVIWHLAVANARGWAWHRFDDIGLTFLEIYRPTLLIAVLSLPLAWWWRPLAPVALYLPIAGLTLLAAGTPGSSRNYALEAGLALAIASGLVLAWLRRRGRWGAVPTLLIVGLLGFQAATLWALPERAYGRRAPSARETKGRHNVLGFLTNHDGGPVLSEDVGLLYQAGLPIEYYDPSLLRKLAGWGTWDQQPLLEQVKNYHFAYIMSEGDLERARGGSDRWTPEFVAAVLEHYELVHRDVLLIYQPRSP